MHEGQSVIEDPIGNVEESKYLVFRLGSELYATPLVTIREIIKMHAIKPVPFMTDYFRGMLNLRGLIVGVIDLRLKLEFPCPDPNQGLLVVVDIEGGALGAIVDDVVSVQDFSSRKN